MPETDKENSLQTVDEEVLEEAFNGDKSLMLFFIEWVANGKNGTKAYLKVHPNVNAHSARVLASKALARISIGTVLDIYGLGLNRYMKQLNEGMAADKLVPIIAGRDSKGAPQYEYKREPDHYVRKFYHDKLGQLLKIEGKNPNFAMEIDGKNIKVISYKDA